MQPQWCRSKDELSFETEKNVIPLNKSSWEEKEKKLLLLLFSKSKLELQILVSSVATKH